MYTSLNIVRQRNILSKIGTLLSQRNLLLSTLIPSANQQLLDNHEWSESFTSHIVDIVQKTDKGVSSAESADLMRNLLRSGLLKHDDLEKVIADSACSL